VTLSAEIRDLVRIRASHVCEYCRLPEDASVLLHQIDHIIGRQHNGSDNVENLCLACIRCNLKKGPNIASIDPQTNIVTALYHPRTQTWEHHFQLVEARVIGLTTEGRATVALIDANSADRIRLRQVLLRRGWTP
jgi:HNH endonuclease